MLPHYLHHQRQARERFAETARIALSCYVASPLALTFRLLPYGLSVTSHSIGQPLADYILNLTTHLADALHSAAVRANRSAILYALAIWISTFAAIGLALRFMSGFSPTWRYLADASYWLYLIHIPIVMALQVVLSQRDWPGLVKFAVILVIAIRPILASYHLLVRFTFIGAVLNGRRAVRRVLPQGEIATA